MNNKLYRANDINANLRIMGIHPLDVLVVGGTGAGKSSTLNSILEDELARIGSGCDPETMKVKSYSLSDNFRLWDSPGLGDGMEPDKKHTKKLVDILYKTYNCDDHTYGLVDMVLVILDGASRDMGTAFQLLNDIIVPNIQKDRILVAINQADLAMKGRHWDEAWNRPDATLHQFLDEKAISVQERILEATGVRIAKPVAYSASRRYNVQALLDLIIDHMPRERRELMIA